ncbi:leucyl/phenylalanyl-tRNA--protein transferase [Endozoicomonas sp. OPT23]|uniref:leucyl/phenylalanyl-tRNA--protein transferase n=1 Tax=Endozoicomonas sp. OPT23 TaxID=2072845 RepID=UPI00129B0643|nr:leucyl/phenylalanyl-tRNA--protein transferase [Endozoicomonas sp. OPT23]MRI34347.1 leucyl/phenylalanyl-tRNA--protein transferase [Endozoicomonas sp. OPT23]
MRKTIHILDQHNIQFPPVTDALEKPDGLLAMGGNLTIDTLLEAYQRGIFPWYNEGEPLLWWSPDPRMVIAPNEVYISSSMKRLLKKKTYKVTFDSAFRDVIDACSEPRSGQAGTWITEEMKQAYCQLHKAGYAHSVEVWKQDQLVGGLYGVAIDQVFFGESMFSRASNTSKLAMIHLCGELVNREYQLIDCQVPSSHLESLGAKLMHRETFIKHLNDYCRHPVSDAHWKVTWQWTARPDECP